MMVGPEGLPGRGGVAGTVVVVDRQSCMTKGARERVHPWGDVARRVTRAATATGPVAATSR